MKKIVFLLCIVCASAWILTGCQSTPSGDKSPQKSGAKQNRVVLYCSVDDVYARPIVAELEKKTGLKIDVLYDVEAAKTAGLANRIRAEKTRPRGDVFWSSALLQTLLLKREGLLQNYSSPKAKDIPAAFKDKDGAWTGMGVRARVVMFSSLPPEQNAIFLSGEGLLGPHYKNKNGISNPQFGTASDWVAALAVRWGKEKTLNYFRALKKNGVRVLPGNGVVAEKVARGELRAGVTDMDDYGTFSKKYSNGKQSLIHANNFDEGALIPGSVAILNHAPHQANAQKLVDALLDAETEKRLAQLMRGVEPLHNAKISFPNDTDKWAGAWLSIRDPLFEILLTP